MDNTPCYVPLQEATPNPLERELQLLGEKKGSKWLYVARRGWFGVYHRVLLRFGGQVVYEPSHGQTLAELQELIPRLPAEARPNLLRAV